MQRLRNLRRLHPRRHQPDGACCLHTALLCFASHARCFAQQIPSGVATLPAGAQFSVYAVGNNFPCITSYSQITDAAVAIGASSLVVILGGPNELVRRLCHAAFRCLQR